MADYQPPNPTARRQATLLDIIGRNSAMARAFTHTELYCRENGVRDSWAKVEAEMLRHLQYHRICKVAWRGRRFLEDLIRLANDFKRAVNEAVIYYPNVAEIAGDLAVRCLRGASRVCSKLTLTFPLVEFPDDNGKD